MFSLSKIGIVQRLRRIGRQRVGISVGNDIPMLEAGVFPSDTCVAERPGQSVAVSSGSQGLVEPRNEGGERTTINLIGGRVATLGPQSNPDNFRFDTTSVTRYGSVDDLPVILPATQGGQTAPDNGNNVVFESVSLGGSGDGDDSLCPNGSNAGEGNGESSDHPANEEEAVDENGLEYLHVYLDTMYYFGTSPYRTPQTKATEGQDLISRILHWMQLTFFTIMVAWALWESFNEAKLNFLLFMAADEGLRYFVVYSFHVFCLLTKMYGVYRLAFKKDDTDNMLHEVEVYSKTYGPKSSHHFKYWRHIIRAVCLVSLTLCATHAVFNEGSADWDAEDIILAKSYEFSVDLYQWKYAEFDKDTDKLIELYGRNLTKTTMALAFTSVALNYSSDFLLGSIRIMVLFAVLVIFLLVIDLINGMQNTMEDLAEQDADACAKLQANREAVWKQYRRLKAVIVATNKVFDSLLQLLHVDNLLLYGFFATLCIERGDTALMEYVLYLFKIVKSELTYFLAGRISKQNDYVRKWIRNWASETGKIVVDGKVYDAALLLDELDKEPLGLGTGNFVIHQEFHFKFLGLVGSLVLFLADDKKKPTSK